MELDITFHEDGDVVSIWLGRLGSQERFDRFIAEQYDDDRDEEPISELAESIGLSFYDHDFVEYRYEPGLARTAGSLVEGHSYAASFEDAVAAQLAKLRGSAHEADSVFLFYGYKVATPAPANDAVAFLGTFVYDRGM